MKQTFSKNKKNKHVFCEVLSAGHVGSSGSNHGPTAGLKTLMLLNLLLSSQFVVSGDNRAECAPTFKTSSPRRAEQLRLGMQQHFSYLESLRRHSLRVSGKLEGGLMGDDGDKRVSAWRPNKRSQFRQPSNPVRKEVTIAGACLGLW